MATQFGILNTFDHNVQIWRTYKGRIGQYFIANNINHTTDPLGEKRKAILLSALSEVTYKLASDLVLPKNIDEVPYDDILTLLDNHFTPKYVGFGERHNFYAAVQLAGETYSQWAARLRALTEKCGFLNVEEALRDKFIMGMLPGREKEKIYTKDLGELTLAKVVELAENMSRGRAAATAAACAGAPTAQAALVPEVFKIGSDKKSVSKLKCSVCGYSNHKASECRFANYVCKKCHVKGHLRKMCGKVNYVEVDSGVMGEDGADDDDIPYLELAEPEEGYHGLIKENETLVEVTPAIRARGPLCSFLILNNKHHGEAPFEIMVIDENEARLRVRFPLNCEKRRNYKFDIAAVGCDGSYSNTVPVHITVTDVNEFPPVFSQAAYVKSVDEGRIYDEIVRVEATDKDCTPRYGDVCKYEILTDRSQPFTIDNEGVIRNTEPLDYEKSHNHILSVVAYDCGMMQSAPVMVTIKVNKPCRAGWKGVAERVDYAPGTGPLALFPAARLETCSSDERCPGVTRIQAAVTLQASRAGSGCDRDTYSLHSQRTICGLDPKTIDLLPSPGAGNEWAKSLKPDSGRDGEQMFEFDGEMTAAVVPESVLPHSLAASFSISTWMRHAPPLDGDKHRKEHIVCLADDHKMNRHHYALFVRNCRLILLLRRDFGEGDLNIFRPAEWRWKLPEVCDDEWHHYAVNVRFPNVELFVDGEPYHSPDGKGPEVIDDWPLHPAHGVNTTLVIGACWQGTENDMKHHLRGWLAGLGVVRGNVQPARALSCLAHCREGLSLAPDLYLKSVSVEGDGVADVETLLRRVAYGDARAFPTPGRRNVHVATTITCDNGRIIKARPAESYIMVLAPQTPSILLNGSEDLARDYAHFRAGLTVFPDLSVRVLAGGNGHAIAEDSQKLDSCVVSVYPALNPDHEALALRDVAELPLRYDIRAAVTRDGVILTGADTVHNYQKVLREIEYSNKKPAYYLNRVFKLTCSELNGRFTSNEYVQTLTVVHPHMSGASEAGLSRELHPSGMADKMDAVVRDKQSSAHVHHAAHAQVPRVYAAHALRDVHAADAPAPRLIDLRADQPANHVALLIGVVSCGVIVIVAGVAIARARGSRGSRGPRGSRAPPALHALHALHALRSREHNDTEMAWDDSALTITVNPMDESAAPTCGTHLGTADSSDGDSCSDSDSDQHDSSDEDDEVLPGKEHKYRNISQLEWDNSTM